MNPRNDHQELLLQQVHLGIIGKPQFCYSVSRVLKTFSHPPNHFVSQLADGWQKTLENHPNFIIVELDNTEERDYYLLFREYLEQIRTRFKGNTIVAVTLPGVEQLLQAGELLFSKRDDYEPSNLIHFFLPPPDTAPFPVVSTPFYSEVLELVSRCIERSQRGTFTLPTMNSEGWINSMGDIQSLRLWLKWLPRYALYTQENPIIIGRTGTGKTNLARAVHLLSGRKGEFVSMTPRDFSSSELVQAELFGAVAGAYTGAVDKWGLVKAAEGGTLFFDEFQSVDLELQGKLITFIENKTYRRVGSAERTDADVRFIFASNRPLFELVDEGLVREDFAYRLERVMLELPPLNRRPGDVAPALGYALAKLHRQRTMNRPITGFTRQAYELLLQAAWPGNLRQLENLIAKACERAELSSEHIITEHHIMDLIRQFGPQDLTDQHPYLYAMVDCIRHVKDHPGEDLATTTQYLASRVRELALDIMSEDADAASRLISDDELVMRIERAYRLRQ